MKSKKFIKEAALKRALQLIEKTMVENSMNGLGFGAKFHDAVGMMRMLNLSLKNLMQTTEEERTGRIALVRELAGKFTKCLMTANPRYSPVTASLMDLADDQFLTIAE